MTLHLERELTSLKKQIVTLGTIVEESLFDASKAVSERNTFLAKKVIDGDSTINNKEVEIEEECLKVLALHQPVAIDLRFIVATLKINNDLERIGDLAANIAARAMKLTKLPSTEMIFDIDRMTETTQSMLKQSLDALVEMNLELARGVLPLDDEVDDMNRKNYKLGQEKIKASPEYTSQILAMLSVSRNLERIGDLATNIAEDIIYMISGDIVRHSDLSEI